MDSGLVSEFVAETSTDDINLRTLSKFAIEDSSSWYASWKYVKILEMSGFRDSLWCVGDRAPVPRANILGVGVSVISLYQATQLILRGVTQGVRGYVAVTGVHGISEAQSDLEFRRILNEAWLVTPDGMPMSWIGRAQGFASMDRVYGPDLMVQLFAGTTDGHVRHFLYGGGEGVATDLRIALERRFPGVCICGTFTPPFRPLSEEERAKLESQLNASAPHIIWVGLSTPKQERFMAESVKSLPGSLWIGVGAAFDMLSGRTRQAPLWMQQNGLEWLFRLGQEPKRLGRRYLVNNPLFVLRIVGQALGVRRRELPN